MGDLVTVSALKNPSGEIIVRAKFDCTVQTMVQELDFYSTRVPPQDLVIDQILGHLHRALVERMGEALRGARVAP